MKRPAHRPVNEKGIKRVEKLLRRPAHVSELRKATGVSEKTIYRWIHRLLDRGVAVVRVPGRGATYRIVSGT